MGLRARGARRRASRRRPSTRGRAARRHGQRRRAVLAERPRRPPTPQVALTIAPRRLSGLRRRVWASWPPQHRRGATSLGWSAFGHPGAQGWTLWVAMGLMLGEAVTSFGIILALQLKPAQTAPRTAAARHADVAPADIPGDVELVLPSRSDASSSHSDEPTLERAPPLDGAPRALRADRYEVASPSELVPSSWWLGGLMLSVALCVAVLSPLFHIPAWQIGISALLACLIAVLAVRALGQTDLNPVSAVGAHARVASWHIATARHRALWPLRADSLCSCRATHSGRSAEPLSHAEPHGWLRCSREARPKSPILQSSAPRSESSRRLSLRCSRPATSQPSPSKGPPILSLPRPAAFRHRAWAALCLGCSLHYGEAPPPFRAQWRHRELPLSRRLCPCRLTSRFVGGRR